MDWNGETCRNNNDCPVTQFCYISKRCVDYLDCSRYNRMKGQIAAQEPLQCGPCLKGYESEMLTTGQETSSCKHIENQAGPDTAHTHLMIIVEIIITIVVINAILFSVLFCYKFYKRHRARQIHGSNSNNAHDIPSEVALDNSNAIASAPPEEERLFIGSNEKKYCKSDKNNKRITETNEYQTSVPYTIQYRHIDAYTSTNNNSNTNDSNSNNNLLSREVTVFEMREDQSDRNIETSQTDLSDHNDDNLSNHNDDNGDTIDSASEPNNRSDKKKSNLIINQVVQQNITINLNGEEY
ncbi:hypothetical protein ACFW04_005487 [Cataglyphis niger]